VNESGSESCPIAGFDISDIEPSSSATREYLVRGASLLGRSKCK